jgi:uncharacterized protein (TIGR02421 family)
MNPAATDRSLRDTVVRAYRSDEHVRLRLPGGGTLNIDRKLPFLFVARQSDGDVEDETTRLVLGEASYLITWGEADDSATDLVRAIAEAGTDEFGSFLILELWSGAPGSDRFVIRAPAGPAASFVDTLRSGLTSLESERRTSRTLVEHTDERHPPETQPLLSAHECWQIGCLLASVEIPPLHRDDEVSYPLFARRLRARLSSVLRQAAYEFARVQTTAGIESYRALGPRRFGPALFDIDRELIEIGATFDLLLLVSPINVNAAWDAFKAARFARAPEFHYRLLPVDPDLIKRRLYNLDLDAIDDPAMSFLLRDRRDELDRQVTMLLERNSPDFRHSSIRLYGAVDDELLRRALDLVELEPGASDTDEERVDAEEFARAARAEIDYYRASLPDMAAEVQVRPDLKGLMVSRGNLLIGEALSLNPHRVEALLHHEVGTHVLTFYNGKAQPLQQLRAGLAGYDELQEGLAVFSEYLAGGLDAFRLRVLGARVIAAHSVEHGADFIETFRLLHRQHGFAPGTAFDITERVHQSGGFTRDMIYLRGLHRLMEHLRCGGKLEPLFAGKIAERHIAVLDEMRERGFLRPVPLVPRVFERAGTLDRIRAVRDGLSIPQLARRAA